MMPPSFCWHVHHRTLAEGCWDYEERERYIRENKPETEIEIRLRWLTPVKGELPAKLREAWEAWMAYWLARGDCRHAWENYERALKDCKPELEALHKQEHPDCPWNGKTLFPKEVKAWVLDWMRKVTRG